MTFYKTVLLETEAKGSSEGRSNSFQCFNFSLDVGPELGFTFSSFRPVPSGCGPELLLKSKL